MLIIVVNFVWNVIYDFAIIEVWSNVQFTQINENFPGQALREEARQSDSFSGF